MTKKQLKVLNKLNDFHDELYKKDKKTKDLIDSVLILIDELEDERSAYRGTLEGIASGHWDEEGCTRSARDVLEDYE